MRPPSHQRDGALDSVPQDPTSIILARTTSGCSVTSTTETMTRGHRYWTHRGRQPENDNRPRRSRREACAR